MAEPGPGDRYFETLVRQLTRFYLRHKNEIDSTLTQLVISAMADLVAAIAPGGEIDQLNKPGPQ